MERTVPSADAREYVRGTRRHTESTTTCMRGVHPVVGHMRRKVIGWVEATGGCCCSRETRLRDHGAGRTRRQVRLGVCWNDLDLLRLDEVA